MSFRFGIIGTGIMGGAIGRVLKRCPQVELAALCDLDPARLAASGA
jgi:predicted dehydrogenase